MLQYPLMTAHDETPMCSTGKSFAVPSTGPLLLHRTRSVSSPFSIHSRFSCSVTCQPLLAADEDQDSPSTEVSSLLSSVPGDIVDNDHDARSKKSTHSSADITGLALLRKPEFWQLWVLIGLLSGVGLMTIKYVSCAYLLFVATDWISNIGHDVQALWKYWDKNVTNEFLAHRQLWHVSVISLCSFLGRLSSGIGSDVIVKRLNHSRFWCAAISATIFALAQLAAIRIEDPHLLWTVSGLCGLAYGVLFGVFPVLVVDTFGPDGFAVNWGFMTLAPVVSGNVFNLFYGAVYDSNSVVGPDGQRGCEVGLGCYRTAYYVTLTSSVLGIFACFWGIRGEHARKMRDAEERDAHREV